MAEKLRGTAYSYIRFSSKIQEKGDSVRRQRQLCAECLTRHPGLRLDDALTLEDLGVSAFRGGHRNHRYALGQFLQLVESGRIAPGSYLIVENLDRLSREEVGEAVELFLSIVNRGIGIIQLLPHEQVFAKPVNLTSLMFALLELARANSESSTKRQRVSARWAARKKAAADGTGIVTARAPAWLKVVDGAFQFEPGARDTLRRIYSLCVGGMGCRLIASTFNREKVPPLGKTARWEEAYIRKIIKSRATVGEYQPMTGRKPDGPVVPNYFPAAVTSKEWDAAQGAFTERNNRGGRPPARAEYINPFADLLRDARTGDAMNIVGRISAAKGRYRVLAPAEYKRWGGKCVSFPLPVFEDAVLSQLREIDPREILGNEPVDNEVLTLNGRLSDLETRIQGVKAQLVAGDEDVAPLVDVLRQLEADRQKTAAALATARAKAAQPLSESWGDCRNLVDMLRASPDQQEARVRLRAALRRIVSEVWTLFVVRGEVRLAPVQVRFTGGSHRDYLIVYRPSRQDGKKTRPSSWSVRSLVLPGDRTDLDLRNPEHVAQLEKTIAELDVKALDR